jgi:CheY-like chemotaxis protein
VARAAQTVAVDPEVRRLVEDLDQARGPALVGGRTLVLWVDDRPDNNVMERQAMATYGIDFVLAESTDAALQELGRNNFDAIISDMGRPPDPRAGYTLLEAVRRRGIQLPYFIYAGSRDPAHVRETLSRGGQGTTNRGDELLKLLLSAGIIRPRG